MILVLVFSTENRTPDSPERVRAWDVITGLLSAESIPLRLSRFPSIVFPDSAAIVSHPQMIARRISSILASGL